MAAADRLSSCDPGAIDRASRARRWWRRAGALFGVGLCLLLPASVATAGTLFVAVPERADPCDFDQLAAALRARVAGAVIVPGLGHGRPGDVEVAFERGAESWTLTLDAAGNNRLTRELPAPGDECVAFAETSALIVERYLKTIAWIAEPTTVTPLPPPPPPIPLQLVAGLGLGGYAGLPGAAPDADLEIGLRRGPLELTVDVAAPLLGPFFGARAFSVNDQADLYVTSGQLQMWAFVGSLFAAYRVALPVGEFVGGVGPDVELVTTTIANPSHVIGARSSLAATPGAALLAGYDYPLNSRVSLGFRVTGRALLSQTSFTVGAPSPSPPTLQTSRVEGDATLRLTAIVF